MLGLTPAVWITEAIAPSAGRGFQQAVDRLAVSDVAVDGGGGDAKAGQRSRRLVEPILPDVAEDKGVVAADDLRRRKTHSARTTGDHRN